MPLFDHNYCGVVKILLVKVETLTLDRISITVTYQINRGKKGRVTMFLPRRTLSAIEPKILYVIDKQSRISFSLDRGRIN